MQLSHLEKYFAKYPIFSTQELFLLEKISKHTLENQLSRWVRQQDIIKLKRGLYCLNLKNQISKTLISNRLYGPSYVSLEYALSYFGLIPDAAFQITAVTSNKTKQFTNKFGLFIYRHVKPSLFWGYQQQKMNNNQILIAESEKALIDYFYLNLDKIDLNLKYLQELRLQNLNILSKTRLKLYARATRKLKIIKIINLMLEKYDELA